MVTIMQILRIFRSIMATCRQFLIYGLAIRHGYPVNTHIKVNNSHNYTILNIPPPPPRSYTFCSIVMVYLSGTVFQILRILDKIIADSQPFWPPRPSFCSSELLVRQMYGIHFGAIHRKLLSKSH